MARKIVAWDAVNERILSGLDLRIEVEALGVAVDGGRPSGDGWLSCHAIDREDRNASAAVNIQTGRYRDHGGDGLSLSLYDLAVRLGRYPDWRAARDAFAVKAGVKLPDAKPPQDPAEHLTWQGWNHTLAALWCLRKPGATPEAVQAAGGRLARYREQYNVVALPVLGEALADGDPIGWVLWNATGGDLPIFHGKGTPPTWKKMKSTGGSEGGLMGLHGLARLARLATAVDPAAQTVWSVEGPTDLMAFWAAIPPELRDAHLVVCNSQGAAEGPKAWMQVAFAGRRVVVIRDADAAGEDGGDKWAAWLAGPGGAADVRRVRLPYEIAKNHGRDLRDWLGEGHAFAELLALAEAALPIAASAVDAEGNPIEAEDDPHRLAGVFLKRYMHQDTRTIRYWREEWQWWFDGRYCVLAIGQHKAAVTLEVKAEFDRLSLLAQAAAQKDGDEMQSQRVTRPLISNVTGALESLVAVRNVPEFGYWLRK